MKNFVLAEEMSVFPLIQRVAAAINYCCGIVQLSNSCDEWAVNIRGGTTTLQLRHISPTSNYISAMIFRHMNLPLNIGTTGKQTRSSSQMNGEYTMREKEAPSHSQGSQVSLFKHELWSHFAVIRVDKSNDLFNHFSSCCTTFINEWLNCQLENLNFPPRVVWNETSFFLLSIQQLLSLPPYIYPLVCRWMKEVKTIRVSKQSQRRRGSSSPS